MPPGRLGKLLTPTQRPALTGDPVDYVVLTRKSFGLCDPAVRRLEEPERNVDRRADR